MVFRECPYCHRPFEAEVLSKKQVDSNEAVKVGDFPMVKDFLTGRLTRGGASLASGDLLYGMTDEEKNSVALKPEAFLTYEVTYRCKHCGKQWTKIDAEAVPLPVEYAEDDAD